MMLRSTLHATCSLAGISPPLLIIGAPPLDMPPVEQSMPIPPMDGTADHPDHYIPEPVRHFLPYFHKQVMEKVCVPL